MVRMDGVSVDNIKLVYELKNEMAVEMADAKKALQENGWDKEKAKKQILSK